MEILLAILYGVIAILGVLIVVGLVALVTMRIRNRREHPPTPANQDSIGFLLHRERAEEAGEWEEPFRFVSPVELEMMSADEFEDYTKRLVKHAGGR
jgi:hypothetical protein